MAEDASGWLWLFMTVGLAGVLAAALAYGLVMWRRRPKGPVAEQAREQSTERVYDETERQQRGDLPS